jgi:cell volume regulation protein A
MHYGCHLDWYVAALVATAVAPTDPAVVFSVLGQRQISGRSGTILEGESGANDPVGIALMTSLLAAGELSAKAAGHVAITFVLQMVVGALVGALGGFALLRAITHRRFSSRVFHVALMCAAAAGLYALANLAHGSGFLAVFVAGIVLGDEPARFKRDIVGFLDSVSGVAEMVAFVALGLTIDVHVVGRADVLVPGLVLAAALALVIRPIAVRACLLGAGLRRNEIAFVLFAGLKGAVPLLLGEMIRVADVSEPERLYGIVVVVVVFSVLVQGSLTPLVATALKLPRDDQRTL